MRIVINRGVVALELSAESESARRELGPVAWSVLETLALAGHEVDGQWMATTNARDLARRLGIGKDRAAAALRTLRDAGLVVTTTSRDAKSARFAASSYEIHLPVSADADTWPVELATTRPSTTRASRRHHSPPPETLDLFSSTS
jgi:hypothetical protein